MCNESPIAIQLGCRGHREGITLCISMQFCLVCRCMKIHCARDGPSRNFLILYGIIGNCVKISASTRKTVIFHEIDWRWTGSKWNLASFIPAKARSTAWTPASRRLIVLGQRQLTVYVSSNWRINNFLKPRPVTVGLSIQNLDLKKKEEAKLNSICPMIDNSTVVCTLRQ